MTDLQITLLQLILIERNRRLVCAYQDHAGRHYAVSRPVGQRSVKYDQCHLLDLSQPTLVQIVETSEHC